MSFDTENFINEVEKRPELYNKKLKTYSDKNLKSKRWTELCEIFIDRWNELSSEEKKEKGNELQSKWMNLRTCFKREYDTQKLQKSGSGTKKRRKYMYFDQMLFLIPTITERETVSNLDSPEGDQVNENLEESAGNIRAIENMELSAENSEYNKNTSAKSKTAVKDIRKKSKQTKTYEEQLLQILKEKANDDKEIDGDKYFLLSLLPTFKKLNDDQRFFARSEIMNIMRQAQQLHSQPVHFPRSSQASSTYVSNAYIPPAVKQYQVPSTHSQSSHVSAYLTHNFQQPPTETYQTPSHYSQSAPSESMNRFFTSLDRPGTDRHHLKRHKFPYHQKIVI